MASRLNARIDARLAKKVASLRRATGQTTTDVVRVALERYHESIEREARPYELLLAGGLIGCSDGPADLSVTYKDELGRSLDEKHAAAAPREKPTAERARRGRKGS